LGMFAMAPIQFVLCASSGQIILTECFFFLGILTECFFA